MAAPSYGDKLTAFCESQGALEVRKLKLQNHFHSLDWQAVDSWLAVKDAESLARAERREERNSEISLSALRISKIAMILSAIAIAASVKDQILALIFGSN